MSHLTQYIEGKRMWWKWNGEYPKTKWQWKGWDSVDRPADLAYEQYRAQLDDPYHTCQYQETRRDV